MKRLRIFVLALLSLGAVACNDSPTDDGPPSVITSAVVQSSEHPLIRHLNLQLATVSNVQVEYWREDEPRLRVATTQSGNVHSVFIPRLKAASTYNYEARSFNGVGESGPPVTGQFSTAALPEELAALQFTAEGTATFPLTMVELMITNTGFNGAFIADENGEIVWYWRTRSWINGVDRRENGNFIMLDADSGLVELTPDLRIAARLRNGTQQPYGLIHHDATVTPRNTVLFFARDTRTIRDTSVVGEAIWEWTPETGATAKRWSSFDHLDWSTDRGPQSAPPNWLHANSIEVGSRGNIIVSARNLDQVFSIAPDYRTIEWRIGGPNPTLQVAPAELFYSQHSATQTAGNRVLLFDNGLGRPGNQEWSRVAEYSFDTSTGRANLVWQFRPTPDIHALRVGSVVRLDNGNTVAAFGWGQGYPIRVYEINAAGQAVWSMTANSGFNRVYRMKPLDTVGGETMVQ